jgi:apurinic endonuclease APN1
LDQIAKIRGQGVVLHPGCSVNKHKGCGAIAESINKLEFVNDSKLILENMAGQGSMIGSTLEELCLIRNAVIPEKRPNVGFCIDTAHIWGKGLYDISKVDEIDKMFQDIDSILGIQNLCLFHLNDSKKALGSNVDRHELIGEGEIWSGRMDVFKYFLNRAKEWGVPCIMETEPEDIVKIYSM